MSAMHQVISDVADLDQVEQVLAHFEQLEAQFRTLRDQLTHCHRLSTLGTLTSIIAHEYNNILTPIISYAQLALAKPDDRELLIKAVEKALAGAERAASISASLLGFARDGEGSGAAAECHLPTVISESINCLGRDPRKDGIQLHIHVPEVRAAIAAVSLQQVVVNLVLNAREAMRRGGDLFITGRASAGTLHLEVRDTGPGIPPQILDRLFEPFVTNHDYATDTEPSLGARRSTDTARKGTGLGLCICRDLIRQAGGDIRVDTHPGRGAAFHITLPLAAESE